MNNSSVASYHIAPSSVVCWGSQGSCNNYEEAASPSLLALADGDVGLTYEALVNTSQSICGWPANQSISHVAFVASSDGGVHWRTPVYLGDSGATCPYNDELEPSFTTNATGSVLGTYIAANTSLFGLGVTNVYGTRALNPVTGYVNRSSDALVFVNSSDSGATFSSGTIVVAGANLARPAIAAFGKTVYIVFENVNNSTTPLPDGYAAVSVEFVASFDGGVTWTAPTILPGENASENYTALSPSISVSASGELAVAYVTNRTCLAFCGPATISTVNSEFGEDVVMASSTNNGSSWRLNTIAHHMGEPVSSWCGWGSPCVKGSFYVYGNAYGYGGYSGEMSSLFQFAPPTAVAWDTTGLRVFVAWGASTNNTQINDTAFGGAGGYPFQALFVATSPDAGATWLPYEDKAGQTHSWEQLGDPGGAQDPSNTFLWLQGTGFQQLSYFDLGLTVAGGTAYLAYQTNNESATPSTELFYNGGGNQAQCGFASFPGFDQATVEWLVSSSDGLNWSNPLPTAIQGPPGIYDDLQPYIAYSSSVLVVGGRPIVATSLPQPATGFGLQSQISNLDVAALSGATTSNVTIGETGLPPGTAWSVAVSGNLFTESTASFAVGVPTSASFYVEPLTRSITVGGVLYDAYSPGGEYALPNDTSVTIRYTSVQAFTLTENGVVDNFLDLQINDSTWGFGYYNVTQNLIVPTCIFVCSGGNLFVGCPMPWYLPTGFLLNVTNSDFLSPNLTVASGAPPTYWSGSGPGNHTGTGFPFSVVMNNSINETMWTLPYGQYDVEVSAPGLPSYSTFTFDWDGVAQNSGSGGGSVLVSGVPTGVHRITDAVANSSRPGWIYLGTPPGGGPTIVPSTLSVNLSFAYVDVGSPSGPVAFHAINLTNGTQWQLDFNGTIYSSSSPWINVTSHSGTYSVAASSATAADGATGYVATGIGPTISIRAGSVVPVNYSPAYKVVFAASSGGAVSPSGTAWYLPGATTGPLTAVAAKGYAFIGWTGRGSGSYTGPSPGPTLTVEGPVVELASFEPLPLNRFDLNFSESGLPAGTPWQVNVAGTPYSSTTAQLVVPYLDPFPAHYSFTVPFVYGPDPTNATRYVPQPGSGTATAGTDYDNLLTFGTEYYFAVTSTPGGVAIASGGPLGGSGWVASGAVIGLAATPAGGEVFAGWVGVGPGSYSGLNAYSTIQPAGPVTEVATFAPAPAPLPAVGNVTFELARPVASGTLWTVGIGSETYASTGTELTLTGIPTGMITVNVPVAYSPDGSSLYVPQNASLALRVTTGTLVAEVTFGTSYRVSITSVGPGTVAPGSSWVAAGRSVGIVATPENGSVFLGWTGSGPGSYSGSTALANITVSGPITEVATFGAPSPGSAAGPRTFLNSEDGVVALAIVGLSAGLLAGWLLWRRRGPGRSSSASGPTRHGDAEERGSDPEAEPVPPPSAGPAFGHPSRRRKPSRRRTRSVAAAWSIVVIVLVSGLAGVPDSGVVSTRATASLGHAAFGHAGPASPLLTPSSGRGAFWLNSPLPNVSQNGVCLGVDMYDYATYQPMCGPTNLTNEPSLNLTSSGVLVAAYTAYTNRTPCESRYPLLANYTYTEVGITTSRDGGATWATPVYLGNTECGNVSAAGNYVNAWQPSVTSLANGTMVVAFVEFNLSYPTGCGSCYYPFPRIYHADFPYSFTGVSDYNSSQLVVAFSYDDGASWTAPTPVNTSTIGGTWCSYGCQTYADWIDQRPSITAYGQTLYLAWTNLTTGWYAGWGYSGAIYPAARYYCTTFGFKYACPEADSGVQLAVSPNGTPSFDRPIALPVATTPGSNFSVAANPSVLVTPNGTVVVAYLTNLSLNYSLPGANVQNAQMYPGYNGGPDVVGGCAFLGECGGFLSDVVVAQSGNNGTSWTVGTAASSVYDSQGYDAGYYQQVQMQDYVNAGDRVLPSPDATYDPASGQVILAFTADSFINGSAKSGWTRTEVFTANGSLATNSWSNRVVAAWSGLGNGTLNGLIDSYFYNPAIVSTSTGSVYLTAQFVNGSSCTMVPPSSYLSASGLLFTSFSGSVAPAFPYCGEGLEVFGVSEDNGTSFTVAEPVDPAGTWYDLMSPGLYASMLAEGNEVWAAWTQPACPGWNGTAVVKCDMLYDYMGNYPAEGGFTANTSVIVSRLFVGGGVTATFQESGLPSGTTWEVNLSGNAREGLAGSSLSVSGVPTGIPFSWTASNISVGWGARYSATPSLRSPGSFRTNVTITWNYVEQFTLSINSTPSYPEGIGAEVWLDQQGYCEGAFTGALSWQHEYAFDPTGLCDYGSTSINYNLTPGIGTQWVDAGVPISIHAIPLNASGYWCSSSFGCETNYANLTFQSWTGTGAGSYNGTSNSTTLHLKGPVNETVNFWLNGYCLWGDGVFTPGGAWASLCLPGGFTAGFRESGLPPGTAWGVSVWGMGYNQSDPVATLGNSTVLSVLDPALTGLVYFRPYTVPSGVPGKVWSPVASPSSPLLGPAEGLSMVTYSLQTVGSTPFDSVLEEYGLPNGTAWSYSVDGTGTGLNASLSNLTILGGSHTLTVNPVYSTNGSGFMAHSIDIQPFVMNESWTNATSSSTTYSFDGAARIVVNFTPIYELTTAASTGGSVTGSGTSWFPLGGAATLVATPDPGYHFVGWTGYGVTAVTAAAAEINVTFLYPGADSEYATFAPNALPLYVVTVSATGLPPGAAFGVVFNGTTYIGNGTFALPAYGAGDYSISVPLVYGNSSSLVRSFPLSFTATGFGSGPGGTYALSSDGATIDIVFAIQYALTLSATSGGTTTPSPGVYWETVGNRTTLTATPQAGNVLTGWSGTGDGSINSTSATIQLTSNGPVTESAQFLPRVASPAATFSLTVTETGLPVGVAWSVSAGTIGAGSTNGTNNVRGLNGTYPVTVPAVRISEGEQYVANWTVLSVTVVTNVTLTVAFSAEYLVTVVAGAGGGITPGTQWVAQGSRIALVATASPGYDFVGWNGTGVGNYTGTQPSASVTVNSAITEKAEFAPKATAASPGAANYGGSLPAYLPWVALVALLGAGFAVGYRFHRSRDAGSPLPSTSSTRSSEGARQGPEPSAETEDASLPTGPE